MKSDLPRMMKKCCLIALFTVISFGAFNQSIGDTYVKLANARYLKGEIDEAIDLCNKALEENPRSSFALTSRGMCYTKTGDLNRALTDLNKAVQISPDYKDAFFYRGLLYVEKGLLNKALPDFNQMLKLDPKNRFALLARGDILYKLKNFPAAIIDYTNLLKVANTADYYTKRGDAYYAAGNYTKANADYSTAKSMGESLNNSTKENKVEKKTADDYLNSGNTHYAAKEYDLAIADYTNALSINPKYEAAFFNKGLCYKAQDFPDKAIIEFSNALRSNPGYIEALLQRASLYNIKEDYDNAIKDYSNALKREPDNASVLRERGTVYYNQKKYETAIADYSSAILLDPKEVSSYANRGLCYAALGYPDKAIAEFSEAIRVNPNYSFAYNQRGLLYNKKEDYDNAIKDYDNVLKSEPGNASAFRNRGSVYYAQKKYEAAIADYSSAILLDPKEVSSYANRALCYAAQGYSDKAIAEFSEAIRIDPGYSFSYNQRGLLYYQKASYDKAMSDYMKVLSMDPQNIDALIYRGYTYINLHNNDLALRDFNAVLALDSTAADGYSGKGSIALSKENYDEAIINFTQSLKYFPKNNAMAYANRGAAYDRKGLPDLAISDYNEAIRIDPTRDAYVNRGGYYYGKGKADLAIADYSRAIEIDPKYSFAYRVRAASYFLKGEYTKAIPDYMQALKNDPEDPDNYFDYFTACMHTGDLNSAKEYYNIYKLKNLKPKESSDGWKFYGHYIKALTDGIFTGNYDVALQELNLAEKVYATDNTSSQKKDDTKYGFVDILFLEGYVLEKLERFEESRVAYEQALIINNNQPDVKEALGRLINKKAIAITVDKTPPTIEIISPQATRSIEIVSDEGETQVIGRAKDASGIKSVTINGKAVQRLEEDGLFITEVPLAEGSNILNVEVFDKNDNKASQAFTVKTNPKSIDKPNNGDDIAVVSNQLTYHAILIAEENYDDSRILDLHNPIRDAKDLMNILETSYTFSPKNIDTLFNASKKDILQTLIQKSGQMGENDNLLIFYAGHGSADKDKFGAVEGYWLPTNAVLSDKLDTYISADQIKKAVQSSSSRHILIIADACYSGSFTRGLLSDATVSIQKQVKVPSRKIMTSGNMEPVPDDSKFVYYLKQNLKNNTQKYLTAEQLFDSFKEAIRNNSDTNPQYAAITGIGDEGGQFVFIKK